MYQGFYLNLARNETRRNALVQHLEQIGATNRYTRFEAVDGREMVSRCPTRLVPGKLGLWLTYENLLTALGNSPPAHVHLIEDDTVLARNAVLIIERVLAWMDQFRDDWDLLFTDVFVQPRISSFERFERLLKKYERSRNIAVLDVGKYAYACNSSVLINRSSVRKYAELIRGQWALGTPLDIYVRQLIRSGQLRACLTVPFITSISPDSSTSDIEGGVISQSRKVCEIVRRVFFLDANVGSLLAEIQGLTLGAGISKRAAVYLAAKKYMLSDKWESF